MALLEARDLVKTYPGVRALDAVSFDLRAGEVHAVVGENGAGKSTLISVLAGVTSPESGTILIDDQPVIFSDPAAAAERGISVVFQELSLSESLSIAENIAAARPPVKRFGVIDRRELRRRTREMLDLFEWDADPETPIANLSIAHRQVVEILKALFRTPRIVILDEPTSSLTSGETKLLFENIRRLKREGRSFVYISHHLREVFEIADRVTVLRDGQRVDTCPVSGIDETELIRKMVGRNLEGMYGRTAGKIGNERLRLESARRRGAVEEVSLSVGAGEIVGLAGLAGAGRTELARSLFGVEPLESGRVLIDGEVTSIDEPAIAIEHGVAYLTESRKEDGLFLEMSLQDNCASTLLGKFASPLGFLNERAIASHSRECRERFRITSAGVGQPVGSLSGGNQQKTLLAMWLGIGRKVLIADEPTRGVDVGARSEIYHLLREASEAGMAILLISSDLPELLGLSDRILVMREGRVVAELPRAEATEENVVALASGVAKES